MAAAILAAMLGGAQPAAADENLFDASHGHHLVYDPRTGIALYGYDPVAYHFEHKALPGSSEFELLLEGVVWRFTSEANKAAFAEAPAIYLPLFGGHDATGVAGGRMTKGDPEFFALVGDRLALFRDEDSRDRFASDPALRAQALKLWPEVVRLQAGH